MNILSKFAARAALVVSTSLIALGAATSSASAVIVMNGTDLAPFVFNGLVDPGPVVVPGMSATLDLGPASFSGNIVSFSYSFTNTTDSVVDAFAVASRIRSFGFNATAGGGNDLTGGSSTGVYSQAVLDGNFPSLGGIGGGRDICFAASGGGSNCSGPNGLTNGLSTSGTLSLTFESSATQIFLDNFIVRYQSIEGAPNGATSGIGVVVTGVPEPSTWAMMLIGFAGLALASRRRQAAVATA